MESNFKLGDPIWYVSKSGEEPVVGWFARSLSEEERSLCSYPEQTNYLVVTGSGGIASAQFIFGQDSNFELSDEKMDELIDHFIAGQSPVFPKFAPYKPSFEQIGKMVSVCYGSVGSLDKLGSCLDSICGGLDDEELYRGEELGFNEDRF